MAFSRALSRNRKKINGCFNTLKVGKTKQGKPLDSKGRSFVSGKISGLKQGKSMYYAGKKDGFRQGRKAGYKAGRSNGRLYAMSRCKHGYAC